MSVSSFDFRDAYKAIAGSINNVAAGIHHVADGLFALAASIDRKNDGRA